jgi:hypothetical protein
VGFCIRRRLHAHAPAPSRPSLYPIPAGQGRSERGGHGLFTNILTHREGRCAAPKGCFPGSKRRTHRSKNALYDMWKVCAPSRNARNDLRRRSKLDLEPIDPTDVLSEPG